jgi:beta-lactamase class A
MQLIESSEMAGYQRLVDDLEARAAQVDAQVGYCVAPFDGGARIERHAHEGMPTASAFKLYVLAAAYAADAAGTLSLDERLTYTRADYAHGSGVLKLLAPGLMPTLRDHARLMIVVSDNVSTNVVMRALGGPDAVNRAVHALPVALAHTEIRDYVRFDSSDPFAVSSPADFTAVLSAIREQRCTGSAPHDAELFWTLRRQTHRAMIPRHLPCSEYAEEFGVEETYRCGTKSGTMPGIRADVGIVETPKRSWAIAVQVHGEPDFNTGDDHPFSLLIADLSRIVFETWSR